MVGAYIGKICLKIVGVEYAMLREMGNPFHAPGSLGKKWL